VKPFGQACWSFRWPQPLGFHHVYPSFLADSIALRAQSYLSETQSQLKLDDIAKEYQNTNMYWGVLYAMPLDGDITHVPNKVALSDRRKAEVQGEVWL
jgi:hypothetical protein